MTCTCILLQKYCIFLILRECLILRFPCFVSYSENIKSQSKPIFCCNFLSFKSLNCLKNKSEIFKSARVTPCNYIRKLIPCVQLGIYSGKGKIGIHCLEMVAWIYKELNEETAHVFVHNKNTPFSVGDIIAPWPPSKFFQTPELQICSSVKWKKPISRIQ